MTRRPFADYGDMAPMGRVPVFGRLLCRLRRYHLTKPTTARVDLCVTCRARWFTG